MVADRQVSILGMDLQKAPRCRMMFYFAFPARGVTHHSGQISSTNKGD